MRKYFFLILSVFVFSIIFAQKAKVTAIEKTKAAYHYLLYTPENYNKDSTYKWPVFIFLHGRSLSGTDLSLVRKYGLINEVDRGKSFPAIIIAPQVKNGEGWNPDKVISCLNEVIKSHRVDTNRISITGMSLGGYGTLHTVGKYPEKFCAAAAFCGGGNIKDALNLSKLPLWIAHGMLDKDVPYSESNVIVKKIKEISDKNLLFTTFSKYAHSELAWMFMKKELYDFFLNNAKGKSPYFPEFPGN
ncbi:MAG: prolyl oligopeptidase family serine peptidase [Bacteroidota bacterium]